MTMDDKYERDADGNILIDECGDKVLRLGVTVESHLDIIEKPFIDAGIKYQVSWNAQKMPYDGKCWDLALPEMQPNSIVILELTDYLTIKEGSCAELEKIENFYKRDSNKVVVVHWHPDLREYYNGPINIIFFPTHSYSLISDLAETKDEWIEQVSNIKDPTRYQCLNGIPKPHREDVVAWLQRTTCNGIISLGMDIPLPKWDYSSYLECDNLTNWNRLLPIYGEAGVNIITETIYDDPGIITEKTLFAFAAMQIPIVIGHQGIVQQCRDHGFDMFDDIVSNEYDTLANEYRSSTALMMNTNLIHRGFDVTKVKDRLKRNQEYLLDGWLKKLENDFNNNVQDIVQNLLRIM